MNRPARWIQCSRLLGVAGFFFLQLNPVSEAASSTVRVVPVPRILTFGIDARDYDLVAQDLATDVLQHFGSSTGKTLALGPIDDDACWFDLDPVTFQDTLRTRLAKSRLFKISYAIDALKSADASKARYEIMEFKWIQQDSTDKECVSLYGELATPDLLLFGRVSSHVSRQGKTIGVTYRWNWKIGDCRTGEIVWTGEKTYHKEGELSGLPDWVAHPRRSNARNYYAIGTATGGGGLEALRSQAWADARGKLDAAASGDDLSKKSKLIRPNSSLRLVGEPVPGAEHLEESRRGSQIWLLVRSGKDEIYASNIQKREALERWQRLSDNVLELEFLDDARQKMRALRLVQEQCRGFLNDYPIDDQPYVYSELVMEQLARLQMGDKNPCAARRTYFELYKASKEPEWKQIAKVRMGEIQCGEAEQRDFRWRDHLGGKTVLIRAVTELDGNPGVRWADAESALGRFVAVRRAFVYAGGLKREPENWRNLASLAEISGDEPIDIAVLVFFRGRNLKEDGFDLHYLDGDLEIQVHYRTGIRYRYQARQATESNPLGPKMSLGVLRVGLMTERPFEPGDNPWLHDYYEKRVKGN